MKKKLYAIILLCALHITTAQAFSLFGYDVTSWATRAFRSIRNYFVPTAAQPTRPAPFAPPMRQAPPAPAIVTAEQQATAIEPQNTQAYTLQPQQQTALRRASNIAGHLTSEQPKSTGSIEPTQTAGSIINGSTSFFSKAKKFLFTQRAYSPEINQLDLTKEDELYEKGTKKIKSWLENPINIEPLTYLALSIPIDNIHPSNLRVLLTHNDIAQALIKHALPYLKEKFASQLSRDLDLTIGTILKAYPTSAALIKPLAAHYFTNLITKQNIFYGTNIMENIIEADPDSALIFTKAALQKDNILLLAQNMDGIKFVRSIMEANPKTIKDIISYVLNHLDILDKHDRFLSRIFYPFDYSEDEFNVFTSLAIQPMYFEKLIKHRLWGTGLIEFIMKVNPQTIDTFIPLAYQHFDTLLANYQDDFLIEIMKKAPFTAGKFAHLIAQPQNLKHLVLPRTEQLITEIQRHAPTDFHVFEEFVEDNWNVIHKLEYGPSFLKHQLKNPSKYLLKLTTLPDNFTKLVYTDEGVKLLRAAINDDEILHKNEFLKSYMPLIAIPQNFEHIIQRASGPALITDILPKILYGLQTPETDEYIKKYALLAAQPKNFKNLIETHNGMLLLNDLIDNRTMITSKYLFIPSLLNYFDLFFTRAQNETTDTLKKVFFNSVIGQNHSNQDLFFSYLAKKSFYPFNALLKKPFTQTQQLLRTNFIVNYMALKSGGLIDYECCPKLQEMTKRVIELEAQEQAKGRYTFVHAHQWQYHFFQEIYTDLWKIMHGSTENYRFTRFAQPPQATWQDFMEHIIKHQEKRKHLLKEGVKSYYTDDENCQFYMLFMNYGLFVNTYGSNTGNYIKINRSENPIPLDPMDFFATLGLNAYLTQGELKQFEQKLKTLREEHTTLTSFGGGLLLSFTPEALKEAVYPVRGGGKKRTVEIEGIGETSDSQTILDTLRNAPKKIKSSDHMEFVCVLSHDCTLIPNNGLDIYEFNAADPVKLAAWRAKKDALMQKIKAVVDQKRAGQQAQQIKPGL